MGLSPVKQSVLLAPGMAVAGATQAGGSFLFYEFPFSGGFGENGVLTGIDATSPCHDPANPENLFRAYWDAGLDSTELAGTGFNNGIDSLAGTLTQARGAWLQRWRRSADPSAEPVSIRNR